MNRVCYMLYCAYYEIVRGKKASILVSDVLSSLSSLTQESIQILFGDSESTILTLKSPKSDHAKVKV